MENLYSNEYQQVLVLKYLDYHNKMWIQTDKISSEIGISKSAVKKMVILLKDLIEDMNLTEVELLSSTNKGIYFERSRCIPLHIMIEKIYTGSLTFKVIDSLLNEKIRSADQFAMDNYISVASIKRKIFQLNKILNQNGIYIKRNKIVGDEYNIRAFLFEFYWEVFRGEKWPFHSIMKKNFEEQAAFLEPHLKLWITESSKEQIYYFLAITEIREAKKHSIKNEVLDDEEMRGLTQYNPIFERHKLIKNNMSRFNKYSEEVYQYIYYVVNSFSLDYRKSKAESLKKLWNRYKMQDTASVKIAERTLTHYNELTGNKLSKSEFVENVLGLCMIHHKAHLLAEVRLFKKFESLSEIKRLFPNMYAAIDSTIQERLDEFPEVKYNKLIIMEEYALLVYDSINLGLYTDDIKIAINMSAGFRSEKKLEGQLTKRFGDRMSLKFVSPNDDHDILITDTQVIIGSSDSSVYIEENRLTDADFDYLRDLFEKLKAS